jgi:hypothetical protein
VPSALPLLAVLRQGPAGSRQVRAMEDIARREEKSMQKRNASDVHLDHVCPRRVSGEFSGCLLNGSFGCARFLGGRHGKSSSRDRSVVDGTKGTTLRLEETGGDPAMMVEEQKEGGNLNPRQQVNKNESRDLYSLISNPF